MSEQREQEQAIHTCDRTRLGCGKAGDGAQTLKVRDLSPAASDANVSRDTRCLFEGFSWAGLSSATKKVWLLTGPLLCMPGWMMSYSQIYSMSHKAH